MTQAKIAVTTDFSAESRASFAAAAAIAQEFSAKLLVLHLAQVPPAVVSPWPEVGPYLLDDNLFEEIEKRLAGLIDENPTLKALGAEPKVVRGESVEALASFLDAEKVGLLVMASHGYSGVKRFFLGSFAEQMLRFSTCPVLVFREKHEGGKPPVESPAKHGLVLRRMLVAHDFSSFSRPALILAHDWARTFGATARLHFVAEHSAALYGYAAHMEGGFKEYLEKVRQEALERFRRVLREDWKDIPAEAVATTGDPVEEILREAKDFGADLIVVGTHTRSGLERFFLGSVAQKTVRKAPCAVLVVRAKGSTG